MRISEQRKQEIVAAIQRSFKCDNTDEIAAIPLKELRETDEMLGWRDRDEGYRIAIRNRIKDLELDEQTRGQRQYDWKMRVFDWIIGGLIGGLLVDGVSAALFG